MNTVRLSSKRQKRLSNHTHSRTQDIVSRKAEENLILFGFVVFGYVPPRLIAKGRCVFSEVFL
jgi:hypothetical protein